MISSIDKVPAVPAAMRVASCPLYKREATASRYRPLARNCEARTVWLRPAARRARRRCGCGPRQAGARSDGCSVCCEGLARGSGTDPVAACSADSSLAELLAAGIRRASWRRPARAGRAPSPPASRPRRRRAAGSQNCCMSETAALAADIASPALTCDVRHRLRAAARQQHQNDAQPERHSQQEPHDPALIPRGLVAALGGQLAGRLESAVGRDARFLSIFDANAREFSENLNDRNLR